jgi:hypothetical protein
MHRCRNLDCWIGWLFRIPNDGQCAKTRHSFNERLVSAGVGTDRALEPPAHVTVACVMSDG